MLGSMLAEAWSALLANRLRSSLTMLGMIIGVAAVILMLAIGGGVQKREWMGHFHDASSHTHAGEGKCHGFVIPSAHEIPARPGAISFLRTNPGVAVWL